MAEMTFQSAPSLVGGACFISSDRNTLASLPQRYAPFNHYLMFDHLGKRRYDKIYFVIIDTEYCRDGSCNKAISYQILTVSESDAVNGIVIVESGQRLSLSELIEQGIAWVHGGAIPDDYRQNNSLTLVVLVAHFFVAEWTMLADRDDEYITSKLNVVRKCPVTLLDPIQTHTAALGNVDIQVYDTMLLAPAGLGSLDKLSSLLGDDDARKIDVSSYYKKNMHDFLRDEPESFIEYALRDTEVTAKVFITLQEALNNLAFGESRQLFKTLGASAVKDLLTKEPWLKKYLRGLRDAR